MKNIIAFIFLLISATTFGQKIFSDTEDPFTNARTVASTLDPLYRVGFTNILQVQTSVTIQNDSITTYSFSFMVPAIPFQIEKIDSSVKDTCMIKDQSGNIYTGKVASSISTAIAGSMYNLFACIFTKEDFLKLSNVKTTDIKITTTSGKGGVFPIDKKRQDIIANQIKALLKAFK